MNKYHFWLYLALAAVVMNIPVLSLPFKWLESYFHEISHGIAALVTGGNIVSIQLFTNGAGLCTTQGGSRFVISFMGYAGAILWGALLYLLASWHHKVALIASWLLAGLLAVSILLWVRDLLTLVIVVSLLLLVLVQLKFKANHWRQSLLKLLGLVVLLNAFFSPWYLIDGRSYGDGASLAQLTYLPEFIWVIVCALLATVTIWLLSKKSTGQLN